MVFRSMPVFRWMSRWLIPFASKVSTVAFKFGFKTFILPSPHYWIYQIGGFTFCRRSQQFLLEIQPCWVGDFEVATGGGFWVAIRAEE
jgi:hypothetical protein